MRLAPPFTTGILLGGFCALASPARAQSDSWALVNARIETVARGTIEKGTIVIRDGLIAAVGAAVTPPSDARVVDLSGRTVYPGLIDLTSSIGLAAGTQPQGGRGGGGATTAPQGRAQFVGLEPSRNVAVELTPSEADLRAARDAGITAVLVAPSRGAFRGLSALMPTRDDSAPNHLVRAPVGLHMGFQGVQNRYPETLLGVIAYERQALYDAQRQAVLVDRARANPRTAPRPESDANIDALVPVVRGTLPAFFAASNENEIRRAVAIGKEFNLKLTIVGATEGFRSIDALKGGRPIIVSVDFPAATDVTGWAYRGAQRSAFSDSAARAESVRKLVEGNAAALDQAGIRFALASGALRPNEFIANVRKAIAAGLPRAVALEALTTRAAEIAGVSDQLGSIEQGKIANLVVTQGDLLADNGKIRMVFVDGIRHEVIDAPAGAARAAAGRRGGGGGEMAQMTGTWSLTVTGPQGDVEVTVALTQSGADFTGTLSSPMGTTDVVNGHVDGRSVSWTTSIQMNGTSTVVSWDGEVDGDRMTGHARMPEVGSMNFKAERKP